jgi:membrane protease YdiL (CAAX protease family)
MGPLTTNDLLRGVLIWAILAIFFGLIASWVWAIRALLRGEPMLPRSPLVDRRKPPWGVRTVLLCLMVCYLVSRGALEGYALATRGVDARPAIEAPVGAEKREAHPPAPAPGDGTRGGGDQPGRGGPGPDEPRAGADRRPKEAESLPFGLSLTELMCVQGAINGILIILLPGIARWTSRARLRDFGLVLRGWRQQAAVGIVAVLILMPIVYAVQFICIKFLDIPDLERRKHPVEKMLQESSSPGVALLAFVTAVVLAPLFEELLFRGLVQTWLVKVFDRFAGRPQPPTASKPLPLPMDLEYPRAEQEPAAAFWEAEDEPPRAVWEEGPALSQEPRQFPVASGGPSPDSSMTSDVPYWPRSPFWSGAAIALTSLFFAALHAPQWPAPIPLFVLALGLGAVYQRTGSLIAPICMHALFNAFSTLMLFYATLAGPLKEQPRARPVLERGAPVEKVAPGALNLVPTAPRGKS